MKVAVLTTVFPRWEGDFFGNYIYHHAEAHVESGADVRVVAPHAPGARTREEINRVRVERFRYGLPASTQTIAYGGGVLAQLERGWLAKLLFPVFMLSFFVKSMGVVRWADIVHVHWTLAGFIGLALDYENQPELTDERIATWVQQLGVEFGLVRTTDQ